MIYIGPGVIHSLQKDENGKPIVIKNGDVITGKDVDGKTGEWLEKQNRISRVEPVVAAIEPVAKTKEELKVIEKKDREMRRPKK